MDSPIRFTDLTYSSEYGLSIAVSGCLLSPSLVDVSITTLQGHGPRGVNANAVKRNHRGPLASQAPRVPVLFLGLCYTEWEYESVSDWPDGGCSKGRLPLAIARPKT